jgi:hypothetical protein
MIFTFYYWQCNQDNRIEEACITGVAYEEIVHDSGS